MKLSTITITLICILGLSGCVTIPTAQSVTQVTKTMTVAEFIGEPKLNTTMGEFTIFSSRFVEEVNGDKPGPGEKILLIELAGIDGGAFDQSSFSLEEFQSMIQDTSAGKILVLSDDGTETTSTMAGWVGPEYKQFVIGFRLPDSLTSYQLIWPGNDPISINPK